MPSRTINASSFLTGLLAVTAISPAVNTLASAATKTNGLSYSASAALKESFDSNVYLQSYTNGIEKRSFVTTLLPQFGFGWESSPAFRASLNYLSEISFFHSAPDEDNSVHKASAKIDGAFGNTSYEFAHSFVAIDGSDVGPTWTGPGGAPAAGGIPIRDRRDALVYRGGLKVASIFDPWIIRPVVTGYVHDFQTQHRATAGYENYVDRNEYTLGVDLGRVITPTLNSFLGYRFGAQDQSRLLTYPEEYDNHFHRVLFGLEGKPWSNLKLNISMGPEWRQFGDGVPLTFGHRDRTYLFVDASATLTLGQSDVLCASAKQFEQPGFTGRSTYQDLTVDVNWKHKLTEQLTTGVLGRAYNTDFRTPAVRDDWIFSAGSFLNYTWCKALTSELSYTYENGESEFSGFAAREYTRHVVALGLKYVLKGS